MELQSWESRAPTPQQDNDSNDSNRSTNTDYKLLKLSLNNYTTIICFLAEFGVLVCKQHRTAVVNLDVHLRDQHATPATIRKQIVEQLSNFTTTNPRTVKLPEQPAEPIQELGTPHNGFKCTACEFITVSNDAMRKHSNKSHELSWSGDKSTLYESVKVQTFFSSGGLQKYFIVDFGDAEDGETLDPNQVVQQQLSDYQKVRKEIEGKMQVMEEAVKTDKTGWFKRTGWLPLLKGRNLAIPGR